MTQQLLTGLSVTRDIFDTITDVSAVLLSAVFPVNPAVFNYSVITTFPDDLPDIEPTPATDPLFLDINGLPVPDSFGVSLGFVQTPFGTHIVLAFFDPATNTDFIFQIGGDPLTLPTTPAEMNALDISIIGIGAITSGPFRPGIDIPLSSFLNRVETEDDVIVGTEGADLMDSGIGNDSLFGEGGNDTMLAGKGDDFLEGGGGNDALSGQAGQDTVNGRGGDDLLRGGKDQDLLIGEDGRDKLFGQGGGDTLDGGAGNDRLNGGGGNDMLDGGANNDFLKGGSRRDHLNGGDGNDRLFGNSFNDTLMGGAGDDTLKSGGDNDILIGSTGNDKMKGGTGDDTFFFADGDGQDTIQDFEATNDAEKIDFSGVTAIGNIGDLTGPGGAATQVGLDVLIDTGGGNSVLLEAVDITDLGASDFIF